MTTPSTPPRKPPLTRLPVFGQAPDPDPVLHTVGLTKSYPGVRALDDVTVQLRAGQVLAIAGHNGAGKSTWTKTVTGAEHLDAGQVWFTGAPVRWRSPAEAAAAGVISVPQHITLPMNLTVAEVLRIGAGRDGQSLSRVSRDTVAATAQNLRIDTILDRPCGDLGPPAQRRVMVAHALLRRPRVLILDEPTAMLDGHDVDLLFDNVRRLLSDGAAVAYISHRLHEILALADEAVVLRGGRLVASGPRDEWTHARLTAWVAGTEGADGRASGDVGEDAGEGAGEGAGEVAESPAGHRPAATQVGAVGGDRGREARAGSAAVELDQVSTRRLKDLTLQLQWGEVLGVAGLVGSGRTSLTRLLVGADQPVSGTLRFGGVELRKLSPASAARRHRIAYVPESRGANALLSAMTVYENVSMVTLPRYRFAALPVLSPRNKRRAAAEPLARLGVQPTGAWSKPISALSGGNQQKAILARWLLASSRIFIFDEPTEGVDVAGRRDIYEVIRHLAVGGACVLVCSSDPDEIVEVCDRTLVMVDGAIHTELAGDRLTVDAVSLACLAGVGSQSDGTVSGPVSEPLR